MNWNAMNSFWTLQQQHLFSGGARCCHAHHEWLVSVPVGFLPDGVFKVDVIDRGGDTGAACVSLRCEERSVQVRISHRNRGPSNYLNSNQHRNAAECFFFFFLMFIFWRLMCMHLYAVLFQVIPISFVDFLVHIQNWYTGHLLVFLNPFYQLAFHFFPVCTPTRSSEWIKIR